MGYFNNYPYIIIKIANILLFFEMYKNKYKLNIIDINGNLQ